MIKGNVNNGYICKLKIGKKQYFLENIGTSYRLTMDTPTKSKVWVCEDTKKFDKKLIKLVKKVGKRI